MSRRRTELSLLLKRGLRHILTVLHIETWNLSNLLRQLTTLTLRNLRLRGLLLFALGSRSRRSRGKMAVTLDGLLRWRSRSTITMLHIRLTTRERGSRRASNNPTRRSGHPELLTGAESIRLRHRTRSKGTWRCVWRYRSPSSRERPRGGTRSRRQRGRRGRSTGRLSPRHGTSRARDHVGK